MLASRGEITDPCPVPLSLTDTTPSSRIPALSHFWIRRMMRRSPIRCSRKRISHSWLILSKKAVTHYPPPRHLEFSDDIAPAAPVRGPLVGSHGHNQAPRYLAA